jgi:hypothetical protein
LYIQQDQGIEYFPEGCCLDGFPDIKNLADAEPVFSIQLAGFCRLLKEQFQDIPVTERFNG